MYSLMQAGSKDGIIETGSIVGTDETHSMKASLQEANARAEATEQGMNKALDALDQAEAKLQEYADSVVHDTELAVAELKTIKAAFNEQLEKLVDQKFSIESELGLAK